MKVFKYRITAGPNVIKTRAHVFARPASGLASKVAVS